MVKIIEADADDFVGVRDHRIEYYGIQRHFRGLADKCERRSRFVLLEKATQVGAAGKAASQIDDAVADFAAGALGTEFHGIKSFPLSCVEAVKTSRRRRAPTVGGRRMRCRGCSGRAAAERRHSRAVRDRRQPQGDRRPTSAAETPRDPPAATAHPPPTEPAHSRTGRRAAYRHAGAAGRRAALPVRHRRRPVPAPAAA